MLSLGQLCGVMPASDADDMPLMPGLLVGLQPDEGAFVILGRTEAENFYLRFIITFISVMLHCFVVVSVCQVNVGSRALA